MCLSRTTSSQQHTLPLMKSTLTVICLATTRSSLSLSTPWCVNLVIIGISMYCIYVDLDGRRTLVPLFSVLSPLLVLLSPFSSLPILSPSSPYPPSLLSPPLLPLFPSPSFLLSSPSPPLSFLSPTSPLSFFTYSSFLLPPLSPSSPPPPPPPLSTPLLFLSPFSPRPFPPLPLFSAASPFLSFPSHFSCFSSSFPIVFLLVPSSVLSVIFSPLLHYLISMPPPSYLGSCSPPSSLSSVTHLRPHGSLSTLSSYKTLPRRLPSLEEAVRWPPNQWLRCQDDFMGFLR